VIRAVNRLIADAVDARASDIHLEPTDDRLAVRFRIDGMLREMPPKPRQCARLWSAASKVMANLNIAERRLPQDGRLRLTVRGHRDRPARRHRALDPRRERGHAHPRSLEPPRSIQVAGLRC